MTQYPTKIIAISFIFLAIAFVIRIIGYLFGNNVALGMEAVHLIVDVAITFFILLTLKIISSNYTKKFSYGLFKLEDLISLALAILVAYTGIELFLSGYLSESKASIESGIFQAISIIPLFFAGKLKIIAGKRIKSPSLEADGKHTYTDFIEGAGVSAGLILTGIFNNYLFFIASILIAFIALLITAYSIGKESILSLLDLPKDKNISQKIRELGKNIKGIKDIKEIRIRWAGPVIFVEAIIEMDPFLSIDEAHPITEIFENEIKNNIEGVYSVTVHVEPVRRKNFKLLIPSKNNSITSNLDDRLAKSNYFAIVEIDDEIKYNFIENPFKEKSELAGLEFKQFLINYGITDIICKNVGEITFGLMLAYGIYCWQSNEDTIKNIVNKFLTGKVERLREPTKQSK
ncbi:MAG: cation diffusion facilitator family transporter [Thermoplasmata archaeon]|nr:cation diffusion facilitator family transporter [Thermoplasmata archaeon]